MPPALLPAQVFVGYVEGGLCKYAIPGVTNSAKLANYDKLCIHDRWQYATV